MSYYFLKKFFLLNITIIYLLFINTTFGGTIEGNISKRSAKMAFSQSSNTEDNGFQEFFENLNPIYPIIIGGLILAGCIFELVHGTRATPPRTNWAHVASKQQPYSVNTIKKV
uniref:Uncharacterized protein n=1 Tax=Strongyloides venezuelensis TaxID=75913 RepID=A0A0K0EU21_STRVS